MQLALIEEQKRRSHQLDACFALVDRNRHLKQLLEIVQEIVDGPSQEGIDLIVTMQELIDHAEGVRDNEQIRLREEAELALAEGSIR